MFVSTGEAPLCLPMGWVHIERDAWWRLSLTSTLTTECRRLLLPGMNNCGNFVSLPVECTQPKVWPKLVDLFVVHCEPRWLNFPVPGSGNAITPGSQGSNHPQNVACAFLNRFRCVPILSGGYHASRIIYVSGPLFQI